MSKKNVHFVTTPDEARELINAHTEFFVAPCGCRERSPTKCKTSKHEVCLSFDSKYSSSIEKTRKITKAEALGLLQLSEKKSLVCRPFRDFDTFSITSGICFCCNCCCDYFLNGNEECDKGAMIEKTDKANCTDCGLCVPVCYFKSRSIGKNGLEIDRDKCYGCGVCVPKCPTRAITMVKA